MVILTLPFDILIIVISLAVIITYVYFSSLRIKSLIRQADEVVHWHSREVANQDAHRERMELKFGSIDYSLKQIRDKIDEITESEQR